MKPAEMKVDKKKSVRRKRPVYMLDAVSGLGFMLMWGGSRYILIVGVMILLYFALKKVEEIRMEKEAEKDEKEAE